MNAQEKLDEKMKHIILDSAALLESDRVREIFSQVIALDSKEFHQFLSVINDLDESDY